MKLSGQVKPVSYLKANAAEILHNLGEGGEPFIITQNGEAKAVLMDVEAYEQIQETLVMLKIIALGNRQIEDGKVAPLSQAMNRLRLKTESAS